MTEDVGSRRRLDFERIVELAVDQPGLRLDRYLADHLPDRSRSELQRWIGEGRVTIAGSTVKASYVVGTSDKIVVMVPAPASDELLAEPIPLEVVYEDEDLLVVNKPPGMVVHPAHGVRSGTLVNALLHRYPDLDRSGSDQRPGIVHRLDKDTSGLMVVARNEATRDYLQKQFKARSVRKSYLTLLEGRLEPPEGRVEAAIGRDPRHRKRMTVFPPHQRGRDAVTLYRVLQLFERFTLAEAELKTGRTHQIRVHFSYLGHPVVGDTVYGRRKQTLPCPRQFLHAQRLAFRLPGTSESVEFTAPLPDDLRRVLQALSSPRPGGRNEHERY